MLKQLTIFFTILTFFLFLFPLSSFACVTTEDCPDWRQACNSATSQCFQALTTDEIFGIKPNWDLKDLCKNGYMYSQTSDSCIVLLDITDAKSVSDEAIIDFIPAVKIEGAPFGKIGSDGIGLYIRAIYRYAVGTGAIMATVLLMFGGIRWITAGGNSNSIDSAKSWIISSITGLLLLMFTYTILYLINPDLVKFSDIILKKVDEKEIDLKVEASYGCCESFDGFDLSASFTTVSNCKTLNGGMTVNSRPNDDATGCVSLPSNKQSCYKNYCSSGLSCVSTSKGSLCSDGEEGSPCYANSNCISNCQADTIEMCANNVCQCVAETNGP